MKIGGLPAHVLLVHAVVVLLPLAALMLALGVLWPTARRKFGVLTPLLALVGLALVPVTTHAGEWLRSRLPESRAIQHHADLGDQLLPWAAALFVLAALVWWLGRTRELTWRPAAGGAAVLPVWATALLTVLSIGVAAGMTITLYRIGDSGAHAVWNGVANLPAH